MDVFLPLSKLSISQRCLQAYTEHVRDRPKALQDFGFHLLPGNQRPIVSVTGIQPQVGSFFWQRFGVNQGPNALGEMYTAAESARIFKEAYQASTVLPPLDLSTAPPVADILNMNNIDLAVFTETGWTYRAAATLPRRQTIFGPEFYRHPKIGSK